MTLYVDSSALVKRYVAEGDSDSAESILLADTDWVTGRHTYVEVSLAIHRRLGGVRAARGIRRVRPRLAAHLCRGSRPGGLSTRRGARYRHGSSVDGCSASRSGRTRRGPVRADCHVRRPVRPGRSFAGVRRRGRARRPLPAPRRSGADFLAHERDVGAGEADGHECREENDLRPHDQDALSDRQKGRHRSTRGIRRDQVEGVDAGIEENRA